jgi:coproporphyrinogen III oxidase
VFLDDQCSGDWERDFAMIRDIGRAFLPAWLPLAERRLGQVFGDAEKDGS